MSTYSTKDFYLACSLMANKIQFVKSEKDSNKNTVFFYFDITNKEDLKDNILNDFLNQECYVNVKKFTWAIRFLRNELNKYHK